MFNNEERRADLVRDGTRGRPVGAATISASDGRGPAVRCHIANPVPHDGGAVISSGQLGSESLEFAAAASETGQVLCEALYAPASLVSISGDHHCHENQRVVVVASEIDPSGSATRSKCVDLAPIIGELREQWRRRQAWHRAEKSLTLQAKALCRRLAHEGDKGEADKIYKAALGKGEHPSSDIALAAIFPLTEARDSVEKHRKLVEKRLAQLAKQVPVSEWTEGIRGVGLLSLASIIGEAGDLSNYSNPAKLWKRMGLAVMPDGQRQRRIAGPEAIAHGYSPSRRSVVWNIGDCIVKAGGPYKAVYDVRKEFEAQRSDSKAICHARAKRYMEKRFLRDLWAAWRGGRPGSEPQTITQLRPAP